MLERFTNFLEERYRLPKEQVLLNGQRFLVAMAGLAFVLAATLIIAFDSLFSGVTSIANLQVGAIAPRDIVAPPNTTPYESAILTEQVRQDARNAVQAIYDPPDPDVARQQSELAGQILNYVVDVRADIYGTQDQRLADLNAITTISLRRENAETILQVNDETWQAMEDEVASVLSRMMRNPIRLGQEQGFRAQLRNQVISRFNTRERDAIVDIMDDLLIPNTFENVEATASARETAANTIEARTRRFIDGQIIVREGEPIDELIYEALVSLNLLNPDDLRVPEFIRALVASSLVLVLMVLYLTRFDPVLIYQSTQLLSLVVAIFLITLASIRLISSTGGDIYIFPYAAMALLFVAIGGHHLAFASSLGLALLVALMTNDSLQVATLIAAGSIIAILGLRRAERLNAFFVAGAMVGAINLAIVGIFNVTSLSLAGNQVDFAWFLTEAFLSGIGLVPATALAAMYLVTQLFNLPTALKLIDLSQPNKPLLQRLLREAPGSYQHSLQVANLAEQAVEAIGGDAQLTHVAALYHDIGKMLNPLFFTENQQDIGNPHDTLNDPYRSADIIIGHVTEGDDLAKQYRLPNRIRDFIREHHGTTEVYVFYQRALNAVDGDTNAVDSNDFRYPGPKPQSKETAVLMMADSCEAAVRSAKPEHKQEIREMVQRIVYSKRDNGQLDESGLTLNDLYTVQEVFVGILQSMFHPRINYKEAIAKKSEATKTNAMPKLETGTAPKPPSQPKREEAKATPLAPPLLKKEQVRTTATTKSIGDFEMDDEEPLSEVPRLPNLDERRSTGTHHKVNGQEKE